MELSEPIDWINRRLQDEFGYIELTRPNWRVVLADEQFEKRLDTWRDFHDGIFIREVTEVREVPKYPWVKGKWILERLTPTPIPNLRELLGDMLAYNIIWAFEGPDGEPIPPTFRACKFVIDTVYRQAARVVGAKYKDPESNPNEAMEIKRARIDALERELFGNETPVGDALAKDSGVGYGTRKRNDSIRKVGE